MVGTFFVRMSIIACNREMKSKSFRPTSDTNYTWYINRNEWEIKKLKAPVDYKYAISKCVYQNQCLWCTY